MLKYFVKNNLASNSISLLLNDDIKDVNNNNCIFTNEEFKSIVNWALVPKEHGLQWKPTTEEKKQIKLLKKTCTSLRCQAKLDEKTWGNKIINQDNNVNWTTKVGEGLIHDILIRMGKNPINTLKNGCCPDWETEDCIYEVKTRNWTTTGTAGEKVLGTMYKYSDIPKIFNKPLKIICVGYEEWELTYGKDSMRVFKDVSDNKKAFLDLAKKMNIEYVQFSEFIKNIKY